MESELKALSLCQKLQHKLEQMTEPKTREKCFRIYIFDFITPAPSKITVFQMLIMVNTNTFSQNDVLI